MACALGRSPGRCASQPVRRGVILVGLDALRLNWRRGDAERAFLSTFGEPAALEEQDKHYVIARDTGTTEKNGLSMHLPLTLAPSDAGQTHTIPFHVADTLEPESGRVRSVMLRLQIGDLVSADVLRVEINGADLSGEPCRRDFGEPLTPYNWMLLEYDLQSVWPKRGQNTLAITLVSRPADLLSSLVVEDVELIVGFGSFPATRAGGAEAGPRL